MRTVFVIQGQQQGLNTMFDSWATFFKYKFTKSEVRAVAARVILRLHCPGALHVRHTHDPHPMHTHDFHPMCNLLGGGRPDQFPGQYGHGLSNQHGPGKKLVVS